ncbi:hypothetical protein LOD99_12760 [Oopsacas minuta]|uniref:Uncharacterized protein n=1 Tax=Oopsacas minuta TaxID=111878 RepID=A0AAV7JDV5_9METZ|nr:hypothetical protein LOD99_12760 [Oopsacas minuta]
MIDFVVYENLKLPYKGFLDEYIRCITDYLGNEACCNAVFQEYYASWLSTLAGFCSTVWAAPALLGLAGRIISQKCCSCVRESHSENRTAITTTNHDRRNELIRGQTLKREENNVGYGNPYPGKIATILTEDSPKVSDKFKKSNTVDDFNEVHH